jgi:proline iminopeptidase
MTKLINEVTSTTGYVKTLDGNIWVKIAGTGKKTPVITLHGGPGFPHDYLETLESLSNDRPIIFYDQLGCGRSDRPINDSLWRCERFVSELETVRKELGVEQFHLFGSSWGTMLGMDYYLAFPQRVKSIIFQSPCLSAPQWAEDAKRLCAQMSPEWNEIVQKHEAAGTTDSPEYAEVKKKYGQNFGCRLPYFPLPLQRSFIAKGNDPYQVMWGPSEFTATGNLKDYDRTKELKQIHVPTLFTCGRYDEATPETVKMHADQVSGSRFVVFEKSAHCVQVEEPEAFLALLREFWDELS